MLHEFAHAAADLVLAAPDPAPTGGPTGGSSIVNTAGIITFFIQFIAPIAIAFLGVIFLMRARSGKVSEVLTSSGIVVVGIAFLGGALVLPFLGDDLVNLFIAK